MVILAVTAIPLGYRAPSLDSIYTLWNTADVRNNVLLYVPLGLVAGQGLAAGQAVIRACLWAAALSAFCELVQFFSPGRFPGLLDLAANIAGAGLGALIASRIRVPLHRIPVTRRAGWICGALAILAIAALLPFERDPHLRGWDPSFQLVLGDEANGGRRWRGRIDEAVILPIAIAPATAAELARSAAVPRLVEGAQPLYRLAQPLDSSIGPRVEPPAAAQAVYRGVTHSGRFTILLRFRPADLDQGGPSRILSLSRDQYQRNFTIGQQGAEIVFRLRTASTGLNGDQPPTGTPPLLAPGRETFLAAAFDGRHVRLYVDGALATDADLVPRPVWKGYSAMTSACLAGVFAFVALALAIPGRGVVAAAVAIVLGALVLLPFTMSYYQQPPSILLLCFVLGVTAGWLSLAR